MANIQKQSAGRPPMDHSFLEAVRNDETANFRKLLNLPKPPTTLPHVRIDIHRETSNNDGATGEVEMPPMRLDNSSPSDGGDPPAAGIVPLAPESRQLFQGVTSDGDGVLHIAARYERVNLVREIPESWSDALNVAAPNKRGHTALHYAVATGNIDMISVLISLATDNEKKRKLLRSKKNNGETCLHDAVRLEKIDAVKKLVEKDVEVSIGPDDSHALVKIHDNEGVSPLYLATTLRKLEIVQFLTEDQFLTPAQERDGVRIKYPAASFTGPGSKTALHPAVLLSKDLTTHLANWNNKELVDKADESGSTPLHLLASTKDKFTMELLLNLDTSAGYRRDNEGSLPIHVAAAIGSREIVTLLSDRRPNCSWSCNNLGQTILHIAVKYGNSDVVDYLCSGHKFAWIFNTRDIDGNTALHLAVLQGEQLIFCRLMRKKGVFLSITNKEERTPLDLAVLSIPPDISFSKTHRHYIMYTLVAAGADHGTYTSGHLTSIANVAKPDQEKQSKAIGKSAGVLAVCALLTLTTAFAEPLSVTNFYYDKTEKNIVRRFVYRVFMISDAMAFVSSVASISCCTLAGFSFTEKMRRLRYLGYGLGFLYLAAIFIILIFTGAMYLAAGSVVDTSTLVFVCVPGVLYPLFLLIYLMPASSVLLHTRALISRLGCSGWSSALICLLPPERRGRITISSSRFCLKCTVNVLLPIVALGLFLVVALLSAKSIKQPWAPSPSR